MGTQPPEDPSASNDRDEVESDEPELADAADVENPDDENPDVENPDDGNPDDDSTAGRSWIAPAAAGAVLVALLVGLGLLWSDRSDLAAERDRRDEVERRAVAFTEAVLTYDFTDLDAIEGRLEGLATEPLQEEYGSGLDDSLRALLVEAEATSTVQILDVYSNDTTGDTATVIVLARTDVSSTTSARSQVTSHVKLDLVRVDGDWLVNELVTLTNEGQALDENGNPVAVPDGDGGERAPEATVTVPSSTAPDDTTP